MDAIVEAINAVDAWVWDPPMIILLLGSHLRPCSALRPDRPFGLGYATSGTSLNAMVYWLISGAVWLKNTYPVTGARRVSRT